MANRSFPVSFALFMTPTIILFSFRMTLPALDSVLDSDRDGEIILHVIALLIGVILFFKAIGARITNILGPVQLVG